MEALKLDEAEKRRRIDTLQYQIQELERAKLSPGEAETLTARRKVLQYAERLTKAVETAHNAFRATNIRTAQYP